MFTFFLIIFLIFFVLPRVLGYITLHMMRRRTKNAFDAFFNQGRGDGTSAGGERKAGWSAPARQRKKIDKNVGEYVKFEEISTTRTTTESTGSYTRTTYTEQQVTDAEWEEIK